MKELYHQVEGHLPNVIYHIDLSTVVEYKHYLLIPAWASRREYRKLQLLSMVAVKTDSWTLFISN